MLARVIVSILFVATTAIAYAGDASAKCYLDSRWHPESPAAWTAQTVGNLADNRRTITSPAELARLRAILRLDRFKPRVPEQDDFSFVADIRHSDGTVESYCAGRFDAMSSDYRRGLRIDRTAFRTDVDRFMGVAR